MRIKIQRFYKHISQIKRKPRIMVSKKKRIPKVLYKTSDYQHLPPCDIFGYDYDLMAQQYSPHVLKK